MKGAVHLCSLRLLQAAAECCWQGLEPRSPLSPFAMCPLLANTFCGPTDGLYISLQRRLLCLRGKLQFFLFKRSKLGGFVLYPVLLLVAVVLGAVGGSLGDSTLLFSGCCRAGCVFIHKCNWSDSEDYGSERHLLLSTGDFQHSAVSAK